MKTGSSTDLDSLYEILKKRKEVKIDDIAKEFNVDAQLVMDWGKILEAGDLAKIIAPRMGKATLRLSEEGELDEMDGIGETEKEDNATASPEEKMINKIKHEIKKPSEEELEKKRQEEKENMMEDNKFIKKRNQDKINEAKKIILESKNRGYDDEFIKKLFSDYGWPPRLIEELLK